MQPIKTVSIIGMGALGLLFGEEIARSLGADAVRFVADSDRVARYAGTPFSVNGVPQHFAIEDSSQTKPADLVLVAVKYTALPAALQTMRRCVGQNTTILSLLNGISSEEIIGAQYGMERVIYTVAQGMDAVREGGALHYTKPGTLHIGLTPTTDPQRLTAVVEFFRRAGVPFVEEADILHRLWAKFMLNVGVNQCCMAFETNYGGALKDPAVFATMDGAMKEVQALAACEGITLADSERADYIALLHALSPIGIPSMRQDGLARRPSEVEMFAGTVCRLAAKHSLPVPINEMLYKKIQEMESAY